jgi:hypothetical protein
MNFNYVSGDEREALYNEVWSEPVITVAKRYGMSDNGLRKHCKKLVIPLPTSGYWAKIKAGKNAAKAPLPEVYGILKRYVHSYVIKLKTDLKNLNDDELVIDKDLNLLSEDTVKYIEEKCSKIQVKNQLRNPHQLIVDHKEETIYRKKRDRELNKASFNSNYYATVKSKYRENEPILPIYVSDSNINRAYRIIDALINTLDDMEGRIQVTKEDGKDIGGFIILNTIFYFEIIDEIKKGKIKGEGNEPVRNLFITVKAQSWFDKSLNQNIQYKDTVDEPLELQLGKMVYQMFVIANRFRAIDEVEDRKQEREWEEQKRKQRLEQMRKGELEEVRSLEQVISDWDKAQKIKLFADSMEKALGRVNDEEKKQKIVKWIEWVRNKADWLDPLEAKYDDLLGKNKHIFDRIIDGDI